MSLNSPSMRALQVFRLLVVACLVGVSSSHVLAVPISFANITSNGPVDVASQLWADISDSSGKVLFQFNNAGPVASVISEIYFDDASSLLSNLVILSSPDPATSPGVVFQVGASPPNLPSANFVTPSFVADLSLEADNPSPRNGVNPSQSLGILFDGVLADVLSALSDSRLRLGMHVQGIGPTGNSDSFVSVPEPGYALATGLSLIGLGLLMRQRLGRYLRKA